MQLVLFCSLIDKGANVVCKSDQIEKVYKLLETRLSEGKMKLKKILK